jgi:hypothetical protein
VSAEADAFAQFLRDQSLCVPYLDDVLGFEHAVVRAELYGAQSTVHFGHEPSEIFESLERGLMPSQLARRERSVLLRPE